MIKAVYFDAIDTLFMPYPNKVEMYQRIIKNVVGIDVTLDEMAKVWDEILSEVENKSLNEIKSSTPTLAWEGFNAKILKRLGYTAEDVVEKGETLRLESWTNPENFSLYPDVRPTLEKLSEQNIMIGCLSNEAEGLHKFFTHFDIDRYFKTIIISEVEGCEKPGEKIFDIAVQRLGLEPHEVIHVGDSLVSDYEGAKNAGLHPVLIDRLDQEKNPEITKIENLKDIVKLIQEENIYANTAS